MVAAAKLRRAQQAAEAGRPYAERMERVIASLASGVVRTPDTPKLLGGTGSDRTHLLVVCTSDRGLAGAFNSNIVRAARKKAEELTAEGKNVYFYLVGRKGRAVIQRLYPNGSPSVDTSATSIRLRRRQRFAATSRPLTTVAGRRPPLLRPLPLSLVQEPVGSDHPGAAAEGVAEAKAFLPRVDICRRR